MRWRRGPQTSPVLVDEGLGRWVTKVARRLAAELVPKKRRGGAKKEAKQRRSCAAALSEFCPPSYPWVSPSMERSWGRPSLTCPASQGSGQQGERKLSVYASPWGQEVPWVPVTCVDVFDPATPGNWPNCVWGQGTGQDGGGLCEYGLSQPTPSGSQPRMRLPVGTLGCPGRWQGSVDHSLASSRRRIPQYRVSRLAGTLGDHLQRGFSYCLAEDSFMRGPCGSPKCQMDKSYWGGRWRPVPQPHAHRPQTLLSPCAALAVPL